MTDNATKPDDSKPDDAPKSRKAVVEFPDREDDGCTHCGSILAIYDNAGNFMASESEAAQAAHTRDYASCAATPILATDFDKATGLRKVDKKTGKLAGEYEPAFG